MDDSTIRLPDGRALAYTDIGDPAWPCVLFFHGADLIPSATLEFPEGHGHFTTLAELPRLADLSAR